MEPGGVALVTGASRGIGRLTALELARRGFDVLATMRDTAAGRTLLDEAADLAGTLRVETLDVTRANEFAMPPELLVLVNNAAVDTANLPLEATALEAWRTMFETNVFGLVEVTRRALPALRAGGRGGVVCNLTSSSIFVPMPFFTVYRAAKAAVSAIGESLRSELDPFGLRVLEIAPGPVDTEMLANSRTEPDAVRVPEYRALAEKVAEVRSAFDGVSTSVADAAGAIVDAILDDSAPLRVACDDIGAAMLDQWRSMSDEESHAGFLAAFRLD